MLIFDTALVWFRRDLRNFDHAALYHALKQSRRVFCVFIFDQAILQPLLESGLRAERGITLDGNYPAPIVQHDAARKRTLERYAVVRKAV